MLGNIYNLSKIECLFENSNSKLFKGKNLKEKEVTIKEFVSNNITKLINEFNILKDLDVNGVIKAQSLELNTERPYMVLDSLEGVSLIEYFQQHDLTVEQFLKVATQITDIVLNLHQNNIIHNGLNPNIFFINENNIIQLIDLQSATVLKQKRKLMNVRLVSDKLEYISPEQTGRTNRQIDLRSDIYSLGIILYELLSGKPPFVSDDPLELIHMHLTIKPRRISVENRKIPNQLELIIKKCLEKNPEDRYQSVYGLKKDLEKCMSYFLENKEIPNFILGEHDYSLNLVLSEKLYGREKEIQSILEGFDKVMQGEHVVTLLSGFPGIGKTSIVYELFKVLPDKRAYFTSGKFDQFKRDIPFSAFIDAIKGFIKQILKENEEEMEKWNKRLTGALGSVGKVIVDVIPEVELIIGIQPDIEELPPKEAHLRFEWTFLRFLYELVSKENPLCIFIDDIQWADNASLEFFKKIALQEPIPYLYIVAAYRHNEIDKNSLQASVLDEIRDSSTKVNDIYLEALELEDINKFIADSFRYENSQLTLPLARVVYEKTYGNPFFAVQFVNNLLEEGAVSFHVEKRKWEWGLEKINQLNITDNVVELMTNRLKKLSSESVYLVSSAACIGNRFDLKTLAVITGESEKFITKHLLEALKMGVIIPEDESEKYYLNDFITWMDQDKDFNVFYRFLHDRVQQAAYMLIPEQDRIQTHVIIGERWKSQLTEEELDLHLFDIVNHLNYGSDLIEERNKVEELLRLNILAGKKAKASAAFESSLQYFEKAKMLLPQNYWKDSYEVTFTLFIEYSDSLYSCGEFEKVESILHDCLGNVKSKYERIQVYYKMLYLYANSTGKNIEGTIIARRSLSEVGIKIPSKIHNLYIMKELLSTNYTLKKLGISKIQQLPIMTDPFQKAVMDLLLGSGPPAFVVEKNLWVTLIFKHIKYIVKNGQTDVVPYVLASYGMLTNVGIVQTKTALDIGRVCLEMAESSSNWVKGKVNFFWGAFLNHWEHDVRDSIPFLKKSYQFCIESGDLLYATYSLSYHLIYSSLILPVDKLKEECKGLQEAVKRVHNGNLDTMVKVIYHYIEVMEGQGNFFLTITEEEENELLHRLEVSDFKSLYYYFKTLCLILFNQKFSPMELFLQSEKNVDHYTSAQYLDLKFFQYISLVGEKHSKGKKKMKSIESMLGKWEKYSPKNAKYKIMLMHAYRARDTSSFQEVYALYKEAIDLATLQGNTLYVAIGNEWTADFLESNEMGDLAVIHARAAFDSYMKWGMKRKAQILHEKYGLEMKSTTLESVTSTTSEVLDLASVLKVYRAISSEIHLDALLKKLMQLLIENAGATRGALIFFKEDKWFIESTLEAQTEVYQSESVLLESYEPIPKTVIQYVIRSKEPVIIENPEKDSLFKQDPYFTTTQSKSIISFPIVNQGDITCVVYLENHEIYGAFTSDRIEVLKLIAAQSAISIENACLYSSLEESRDEVSRWNQQLEQKVEKRTAELTTALENLKNTQNQLVEAEKMSALGNLVAGVAHEINTPLGIGVTAISHLQEKTKEFKDVFQDNKMKRSTLIRYLNSVEESSELIFNNMYRASELVKSFKQVAVDQTSESRRVFNVKDYINETLASLSPKLKKSRQQVVFECLDNIEINSYPGAFSQIISNLVLNSLTHAYDLEDEGVIRISVSEEQGKLLFQYRDDGKGMSKETVENVFEPFFTTNRSDGTGLGMHIVFNIVTQQLKGSISCESKLGEGAIFLIEIPI